MSATAVTTQPRPRAKLPSIKESRFLGPIISTVVLLGAWQLVASSVSSVILPQPGRVAESFVQLTQSGELPRALVQTVVPFLHGLIAAVVVGIIMGLTLGLYPTAAKLIDPYIFILWSTPNIALLPLMIVWFGLGYSAQVIFVFLSAVFPIIINTQAGVKQVESSLVEVARSFGGNRWEVLRIVVVPSTFPYMFSGVRIALGRAIVGIIVAQILIAATGIGYMLQFYGETLQLHKYFAPLIASSLLAVVITQLANWLERRLIRWKPPAFS
jgi:ABC-type nitrate/sulfonate/bicarbonate transport system permease component